MIETKIKGYISIAAKAGYVIYGTDNLNGYKKKLYLVLAQQNSGNYLMKTAESLKELVQNNVFYVEDMEKLTGIKNCKILGVKNKGISDEIIKLLRSENFGK